MHDPLQEGDFEETEKVNVVPLADLTLVLLIVLMVLSPMISQSMIHVSVPAVKADESAGDSETATEEKAEPLLISITGSGYAFNNTPVASLDHLLSALDARLQENRKRPVLVTADRDVLVKRVVEVLDEAKTLGAESVSLVKDGDGPLGGRP
jgi:biopolymer transport protein ExbD